MNVFFRDPITVSAFLLGKLNVAVNDATGYGPPAEHFLYVIDGSTLGFYVGARGFGPYTYNLMFPVGTIPIGEWVDIELTRDATGRIRCFLNGNPSPTSIIFADTFAHDTKDLTVGGHPGGTSLRTYIDNVQMGRFCAHTASFTPA
jgi:hypothetical protein